MPDQPNRGHNRTFDHDEARRLYATGDWDVRQLAYHFGTSNRNMNYVVLGNRKRSSRAKENKRKREWWNALSEAERRAYYDQRQVHRDRARLERWADVPVKPSNAHAQDCDRKRPHRAHLWAPKAKMRGWWCSGVGQNALELEALGRDAIDRHGGALRKLAEHDGPENAERPPQGSALTGDDIPTGASPCPDETPSG